LSNPPPDREEASDAKDALRTSWVNWLVGLVVAPVLYVLSIGPANWLGQYGYLPGWALSIYAPLDYLPPSVTTIIDVYMDMWVQ
jgi:hypothetical protein